MRSSVEKFETKRKQTYTLATLHAYLTAEESCDGQTALSMRPWQKYRVLIGVIRGVLLPLVRVHKPHVQKPSFPSLAFYRAHFRERVVGVALATLGRNKRLLYQYV